MSDFGKIQICLFLYSESEWKIECLRKYVRCVMLPLSVNVFKKFVVFWVESRIALFIWKRPFWSFLELIWKQSLLEKICSVVCEYFVSRSCEAMITSNEKENHRTGITNQFSVYLCCWWCDNYHAIKFACCSQIRVV